jgi:hypothetical protein
MSKPNTYNLLVIIGVIVLIILSCYSVISNYLSSNDINELLERDIQENNIVKQEVGKLGLQITTASSNYVSRNELKDSDRALVKQLRKELEGPVRTLERTTQLLTSRIDSLALGVRDTVVVINGRTIEGKSFKYSNEWISLNGLCSVDSVWLNYTMKADYHLEYHWKNKSLFGPKELNLIVRSKDPNVRIDAVKQFQIVDPTPWYKRPLPMGVAGFASGLVVGLVIDNIAPNGTK